MHWSVSRAAEGAPVSVGGADALRRYAPRATARRPPIAAVWPWVATDSVGRGAVPRGQQRSTGRLSGDNGVLGSWAARGR